MSEELENLADWFSQDFDLTSQTVEKAVENYIRQNGPKDAQGALIKLEALTLKYGYTEELSERLMEYGWEWFAEDSTCSSWMPKLLRELREAIQNLE